jgi:hypothetical protein
MLPSGSANLAILPQASFRGGSGNRTEPLFMRATKESISSVTNAIPVSPGSRGAIPSHK